MSLDDADFAALDNISVELVKLTKQLKTLTPEPLSKKDRRERIATACLAAMLSTSESISLIETAVVFADALIARLDKKEASRRQGHGGKDVA